MYGLFIFFVCIVFTDCFADITIARRGYPRMAISACFGGIIFSILKLLKDHMLLFLCMCFKNYINNFNHTICWQYCKCPDIFYPKTSWQKALCMPLTPHKDMLFGIGLGCLLQMFQNNNVVTVSLILYTQCLSFPRKDHIHVTRCYILYNHLRICCKLLVSWILV